MKFRNVRTGIILDLPDNFTGKYWEPVNKPVPKPVKKKTTVKKPAKK